MSDKDHEYIKLTPARMKALHDERKRTQVGSHRLLRDIKPKYGLYPGIIEHWIFKTRSARKDQYEYVLQLYAALPNFVELTKNRIDALLAEKERTAIGISALLKKSEKVPSDLNAKKIENWLLNTKHAKEEHYSFVLALYRSQPTNIECDALLAPVNLKMNNCHYRLTKKPQRKTHPDQQ